MKNIFIIGSKGIPSNYGGFETFVEKLTQGKVSDKIKYHVSCLAADNKEFYHNNARCFNIAVPNIGPAKAVYYDVIALKNSLQYIKENNIKDAIIYILACRIGPFLSKYKKKAEKLGVKIYVNPDGHEWKRGKWNFAIKKYWKISEQLMVKNSDLLICDSKNIEKYIKEDYKKYNPKTTFIAYGADLEKSKLSNESEQLNNWYKEKKIQNNEYYLIVGRFVPENNYETMIVEFMKSKTKKDLVIITNVEENKFYESLKERTGFDKDERIKFVGTVYNQELLKKVRENAFAYLHGHEVGGTNPSLLEALATTNLNILLNVGFNKEVAEESAVYFEKNNLSKIIDKIEKFDVKEKIKIGKLAKARIEGNYSWEFIIQKYEILFLMGEN
ncbi:MAG: beta 1-4 rhamnosyltransferase Cps2T [Sarcina sp.]